MEVWSDAAQDLHFTLLRASLTISFVSRWEGRRTSSLYLRNKGNTDTGGLEGTDEYHGIRLWQIVNGSDQTLKLPWQAPAERDDMNNCMEMLEGPCTSVVGSDGQNR